MEEALRWELVQAIPELAGEIYPTNAPETCKRPYLVYHRKSTNLLKTLDGYSDNGSLTFFFDIMATRYNDMKNLRDKVEVLLLSLAGRGVGEDGAVFVEDLTINNIEEVYEHGLKVNRGIIDFTIYF